MKKPHMNTQNVMLQTCGVSPECAQYLSSVFLY